MTTRRLHASVDLYRPAVPAAGILALLFALAECGPATGAALTTDDAALFERLDANRDGRVAAAEVSGMHQRLFHRLVRKADEDKDGALSRDEFAKALAPSRPDKRLKPELPESLPEADAARWLLLTMDVNRDGWIESEELPEEFDDVFASLADRLDSNKNNVLETQELYRGGPRLAQVANRYARQNGIDVDKELRKLRREQGDAVNRFEERRNPLANLADPERAQQTFDRLDANRDGRLDLSEVPEPLQRPIQRMLRSADRDGDGRLSQREFLAGARRLAARRDAPPANSTPAGSGSPDRPATAN